MFLSKRDMPSKKDLGDLIAKRIEEENPDLVRDLRKLVNGVVGKIRKPWYLRFYEGVKDFFYRDKNY